jgi:hypothetical protein
MRRRRAIPVEATSVAFPCLRPGRSRDTDVTTVPAG